MFSLILDRITTASGAGLGGSPLLETRTAKREISRSPMHSSCHVCFFPGLREAAWNEAGWDGQGAKVSREPFAGEAVRGTR